MKNLKFCLFIIFVQLGKSIIHQRSLIWTVKSERAPYDVLGIVGDPSGWVYSGYDDITYTYFGANEFRNKSRREALSYDYATRRLFFSDNGFKTIFKTTLQEALSQPYVYNSSMSAIFAPTSNAVLALAFDWASGSLYWADSILNHIKVANSVLVNIARTIVSENLDSPKGIAVFPSKGMLYWTNNLGPRIELSNLDGSDRRTLLDSNLVLPTALSLDQSTDSLFFIDAGKMTLERVHLTTKLRFAIIVRGNPIQSGLAHFSSFIFIADQRSGCIEILNKTTFSHVNNLEAGLSSSPATPFDIRMYDPSLQTPFHSNCVLLRCEHICISDGGQEAHCICADGYGVSSTDQTKCILTSGCDTLKCEHECVTDMNNQPKCACRSPMHLFNATHCAEVGPKTNLLLVDQPALPTAALIAIIVASVLLLLLISILIFGLMRRRRNRKPDLTPSVSYLSDTTTMVSCQHTCPHSSPPTTVPVEDVYSEISTKVEDLPTNKTMTTKSDSENNDYTMDPFHPFDPTYENNFVFNNSNSKEDDWTKYNQSNDLAKDMNSLDFYDIMRNNNLNQNSERTDNFENECKDNLKSQFSVFEPGNFITEIESDDLMQPIIRAHLDIASNESQVTDIGDIRITEEPYNRVEDKSGVRKSIYLPDATLTTSDDQNT